MVFNEVLFFYDCWAYFAGRKHYWGGEKPCGVMCIESGGEMSRGK